MTWSILYHHAVEEDLESVGPSAARRILRTIASKLTLSPLDFGAPLSGNLANFRKLRVGDYRVVYRVPEKEVVVYVLVIGPRSKPGQGHPSAPPPGHPFCRIKVAFRGSKRPF